MKKTAFILSSAFLILLAPAMTWGADIESGNTNVKITQGLEPAVGECSNKIEYKKQIVVVENRIVEDPKDLMMKVIVDGKDSGPQVVVKNETTIFSFTKLDPNADDVAIEVQKIGDKKLSQAAILHLPRRSLKNHAMTLDVSIEEKSYIIRIEINTGCDVDRVKNFIVKFTSVELKH